MFEIQTFPAHAFTLEKMRDTAALAVTHMTSPMPPETLVFVSLSNRVPFFVGTTTGIWEVNGASIRRVERNDK